MGIQSMKVQHHNHHHHQFTRGLPWDQNEAAATNYNLLSLVCKRLRPLAPKVNSSANNNDTTAVETFDPKSFIRPDNGCLRKPLDHDQKEKEPAAVQVQAGGAGTRWNPTQEQIGVLETLYKNGMRTPNAQQIDHIAAQLREYGRIEGKNVFYWFQNHKARDRQKHKRNNPAGKYNRTTQPLTNTITAGCGLAGDELEGISTPYKRKCSAWSSDQRVEEENYGLFMHEGEDRTLKLFPLHPEGRLFLN